MEVIKTDIPGLLVLKPTVFEDRRGFFVESYNEARYHKFGIDSQFIQDNTSKSSYGVIRGLHFQLAPYSQAKLVQVLKGSVLDVAVDLRKGSPTYGQHYAIEISEENKLQFFIPEGFAHGFSVQSEEVIFTYKCNNYYNKEAERGISYNDPFLNIDWKIAEADHIISHKDSTLPSFKEAEKNFLYNL
ncbi:dTDP-4-dehydrorhamnose 3,5-epimerase [Marinilabiliaceae bacterium JC017]|nr:dTDP-4-dehydrorhamnose 3,5-epimerase [Marinilabiliaceae bacterium JC017]